MVARITETAKHVAARYCEQMLALRNLRRLNVLNIAVPQVAFNRNYSGSTTMAPPIEAKLIYTTRDCKTK
jgi:hypothetical protein